MKLSRVVNFEVLEYFGYHYEPYLIFPTYQKVIPFGNRVITIDILIKDRTIFINKSKNITKRNMYFINDLIKENLVEED